MFKIIVLVVFGLQLVAGTPVTGSQEPKVPPRSSFNGYLLPEESFQFTFQCDHENKTACTLAENAVKQVGILMANDLLFKRPATVKVTFQEFTSKAEQAIFAHSISGQRMKGSKPGQMLAYPTILAKQAVHFNPTDIGSVIESYLPFDVKLIIDLKKNWNFFSNSSNPMDIAFVTAYELTKALGFHETADMHYSTVSKRKIFLPEMRTNYSKSTNESASTLLSYPTPLASLTYAIPTKSQFQKCKDFLVKKATPCENLNSIAEHFTVLNDYQMKLLDYRGLRKDSEFLSKAVTLQKLLGSWPFEARFEDGFRLPLQSEGILGRMRATYFGSPKDFIIGIHNSYPSLANKMEENEMTSIFGPVALKFFAEIGYSTRLREQRFEFKASKSGLDLLTELGPLIDGFAKVPYSL